MDMHGICNIILLAKKKKNGERTKKNVTEKLMFSLSFTLMALYSGKERSNLLHTDFRKYLTMSEM